MFIAESEGESFLKIGQHLAKLWARVGCPVYFWFTGYDFPISDLAVVLELTVICYLYPSIHYIQILYQNGYHQTFTRLVAPSFLFYNEHIWHYRNSKRTSLSGDIKYMVWENLHSLQVSRYTFGNRIRVKR